MKFLASWNIVQTGTDTEFGRTCSETKNHDRDTASAKFDADRRRGSSRFGTKVHQHKSRFVDESRDHNGVGVSNRSSWRATIYSTEHCYVVQHTTSVVSNFGSRFEKRFRNIINKEYKILNCKKLKKLQRKSKTFDWFVQFYY